jgi:flagellar basal-body rod protein FlgG
MKALKIAATGMMAQQTRVAVVSNNIANMSTTAFSPRRAEFADLYYEQIQRPGAQASDSGGVQPTGVQVGLGVRTASIAMDMKQGTLKQTENEFDLAIQGRGWFEVELPDGSSAYTRDGSFRKGPDGLIVTAEGFPLVPEITVPEDARQITVTGEGVVSAVYSGTAEAQEIGRVTLTTFVNEKGLEALGGNRFAPTEASGEALVGDPGLEGRGLLRQGWLEQSGVDVVSELTELIEAQRGYEMNAKVMTAADQMLAATGQVR